MAEIINLGPVGFNPTGNYDNTRSYEKLDMVLYQGSSYVAKQSVIGQLPTNAQYWDCVATGTLKQFTYDNVAEMKLDNSLEDGMYAQTVGYYEANDGGAAIYKITSEESETEYQEELENGLYATLIVKDYVFPEMFGAFGDGLIDDTIALQNAIDYMQPIKGTIKLLNKTYLIGNITIPSYVNIIGDGFKSSILKAKENITGNFISITQQHDNYNILRDFMIMGNKENNTLSSGLYIFKDDYVNSADSFITVENLLISNVYGDGIYNGPGGRENRFRNIIVEYCGGHGINSQSSDCYFEGITCKFNTKNGLHVQSGACRFINIKCFLNGYNNSSNSREDIAGFWVAGTNNLFSTCDAQENYGDGFYIKNSYNSFVNCIADANGFKSQRYNQDGTYADMTDEELEYDGFFIVTTPVVKNCLFNVMTSDHRRTSNHQLQRYGINMGGLQESTIIMNGYANIKPLYYDSGFQVNINYYGNNYVEVNGHIVGSSMGNRVTLKQDGDVKSAIDMFIDSTNTKKVRLTSNNNNTFQIDSMNGATYKDTPFSIIVKDQYDGSIYVGDYNKNYNLSLRGKGIGFFGKSPVAQQTTVSDATDLASCIYLANQLKAKLQNLGLIAEDN